MDAAIKKQKTKIKAEAPNSKNKKYRQRSVFKQIWVDRVSYALIAPFMTVFLLFTVIPVFVSLLLSFTDFNLLSFPNWVWFENYIALFLNDEVFLIALRYTMIIAFVTGPISFVACFLFAWLVNELPGKARALMVFLIYVPSISGSAFFVWSYILGGERYAILNSILLRLGIIKQPMIFLSNPKYILTCVIVVTIWMSLGASFLALIAGLRAVDTNLYEAAAIDGVRNRFQELIYVTLPNMKPQLLFAAVMSIAGAFNCGGVTASLAGNPPPSYVGYTISLHIGDYAGTRFEIGYAGAMNILLLLVMLLVNKVVHKYLVDK